MTSVGGPVDEPGPVTTGPTPAPAEVPLPYPVPPYPASEDRLTRFGNRVRAKLPRWATPVAVLGCVGAAVGYTMLVDPTRSAPDALPTCLLKLTTGLDCPGCGGTRAFWYLLHGDLPAAARHHLVFVFAVPFLIYAYLVWAGRQMFGWRLPQPRVTPTMIGVFLGGWLIFSVLRNLPWAPFDWLYV